eukprot:12659355-Alexandrium_andersonii.AAC.1
MVLDVCTLVWCSRRQGTICTRSTFARACVLACPCSCPAPNWARGKAAPRRSQVALPRMVGGVHPALRALSAPRIAGLAPRVHGCSPACWVLGWRRAGSD